MVKLVDLPKAKPPIIVEVTCLLSAELLQAPDYRIGREDGGRIQDPNADMRSKLSQNHPGVNDSVTLTSLALSSKLPLRSLVPEGRGGEQNILPLELPRRSVSPGTTENVKLPKVHEVSYVGLKHESQVGSAAVETSSFPQDGQESPGRSSPAPLSG